MKKKYAILFPGQGVQYVGMGKEYYQRYDKVKKLYKLASEILEQNMEEICFESNENILSETINAQPAILLTSYAAYISLLEEIEYKPQIMMGHSLGEITALLASEILNFEDALNLVKIRAKSMHEAAKSQKGAMLAVMTEDVKNIELACGQAREKGYYVIPANYNTSFQTVISGTEDAIEYIMRYLQEKNVRCMKLKVQGAFHSKIMQGAYEKVLQIAKKLTFNKGDVDIISNVESKLYSEISDYSLNLATQIISPVCWLQGMLKINELQISNVIDLGPGNAVANMARRQELFSLVLSEKENHTAIVQFLKEKSKDSFIKKCLSIAVCTPNNNPNENEYMEHVVAAFQKIKDIKNTITEEKRDLTYREEQQILEYIDEILTYKKVSEEEKYIRMNEIIVMRENNLKR